MNWRLLSLKLVGAFLKLIGIFFLANQTSIAKGLWSSNIAPKQNDFLDSQCVQIFYDRSKDPKYWMGKTYSIFLQNLLGHFPHYQLVEGAIEEYQSGDIEKCKATFYLGSYFENDIPETFIKDFAETRKPVVWMGYSIWKPSPDYFTKLFGYTYTGLSKLNTDVKDSKGRPTFFKFATYKGQIFKKWGEFSKESPTQFLAPFENVLLKPNLQEETFKRTKIHSELIHNGTQEKTPYILQNENRFYVADIPFSFMHESDRFLIVADLLFDILNEKPLHQDRYAFLRIEDIFPQIELSYVYDVLKVLKSEGVKASFSVVPIYADPFNYLGNNIFLQPAEFNPSFVQLIRDIQKDGHGIIWHGVTHQLDSIKNPHTGMSTNDFEFWDAIQNRPLGENQNNVNWVLKRLEDGLHTLNQLKVRSDFWLTPHYQASGLNYVMFAHLFKWNVGRIIYFNDLLIEGLNSNINPADLLMGSPSSSLEKRLRIFSTLKVSHSPIWNGQMFPYLIFGDIYGQKIIPENLGNSQPYESNQITWPRAVSTIIEDAKRNLVLRDVWGSVFYHPLLLDVPEYGGRGEYPGDAKDFTAIIRGLKQLGYRFITIDEADRLWGHIPKRRPTISIQEFRKKNRIGEIRF